MDIRALTPTFAVAPQLNPADLAGVKAAGYTTLICNRPDHEVPPMLQAKALQAAAESAGLKFIVNPVEAGTLGDEQAPAQGQAVSEADGPVLAYCRSGTRSAVVWALSQAAAISPDDIIDAGKRGGYDLTGLRAYLEASYKG
ncbi:MAG: TIGR01244 family sulfur transferase [Mangrovicoccus sp.]